MVTLYVAEIFGAIFTLSFLGAFVASGMLPYYVDPKKRHLDPDLGKVFRRGIGPPKIILDGSGVFLWKLRLVMIVVAVVSLIVTVSLNSSLKGD